MSTSEAYTSVDEAALDLVYHAPFYAHVLAGLPREIHDTAKKHQDSTLYAEGPRVKILVDEGALCTLSKSQARGLLKHEVLHLLLGHPLRRDAFPDKARFDLAADLVVTALLAPDERGENDPVPSDFPDLALPAEATVDQYYARLAPLFSKEMPSEDDHATASEPSERRSHEAWSTFAEGGVFERLLREAYVHNVAEEAYTRALRAGRGSSKLLRALGATIARKAAADWRTVLRRFRASAENTRLRSTIQRPSRRFGTVPGTRIVRLCRIVVVIDTSGSVSAEDLAIVSAELRHLSRTGAEIFLIYCDATVVGSEPFTGALPAYVPGGGGTSFDPGLLAADARDPDGIVYFTDGYAAAVQARPRAPVLWVLTPLGREIDAETEICLPGRIVKMAHG